MTLPTHPRRHARSRGWRPLLASVLAVLLTTSMATTASAADAAADGGWHKLEPPLSTPWTDEVGPDNAHPDYPRPQLTRHRWHNLNGVWQYGAASDGTPPFDTELPQRILVPYPPESALSGIGAHDDAMWYKRTFTVPRGWHRDHVLLHFGAVDQQATVWVNGVKVAHHEGGYASFTADITDALHGKGNQQLVVRAQDRNESAPYPVGKQRNNPGGIFYTGSSGIWQTVWMEPVAATHVQRLEITPDVADDTLVVTAHASGKGTAEVTVRGQGGRGVVARADGTAGEPIRVHIDNPRLWSPKHPYLYDVTVRLRDASGSPVDTVGSYAGMRSVSLLTDTEGRKRIALNGDILFQLGPLDQGYWPDGSYTAPTDEALRYDLERTKQLGFNMVRKHMKVEPDRWYYWADKLGLLVWQDMPALRIDADNPPNDAQREHYTSGLRALVSQHYNHPSIVTWVPFNEGWGEFDTARIAGLVKDMDPTRLVDPNSGVNCCYSLPDSHSGDIYDDHTYVGPGTPDVHDGRAVVDGEFGGLGLVVDGHTWPVGTPQAYEMETSSAQLTKRYGEVSDALAGTITENGVCAAVYTQTTDVEDEVNGLLTYDRKLTKLDADSVRARNEHVIQVGSAVDRSR